MYNLDTPIIELNGTKSGKAVWTARNAVEGVQIFGGIGSGKTSGSGRMLALKYLHAGWGGLVLTVKPDEKKLWQDYCEATGRTADLIVVEPGSGWYFDFLDYEGKDGSAYTENIVQVLKTVMQASKEKAGRSDEDFWETALDMLLTNTIDLCRLAYGKVSIQDLYDIVQHLPQPGQKRQEGAAAKTPFEKAYQRAEEKVDNLIDDWVKQLDSDRQKRLQEDEAFYIESACAAVPEARLFNYVSSFFETTFRNLAEKTRSVIDFSFAGFLFRFLREPIYSLFCKYPTNFLPEDCANGKIILINLPVKLYHKAGRDCQILFKYIWQRAMERKPITEDSHPVFLWADEAQHFLHEHDAEYQATARSSRIATVYISQNLPNYLANMSGDRAENKVRGFLGTLGTKIFHANADTETNKYASELIGDGVYADVSRTTTAFERNPTSRTESVRIDRLVRPEEFARLKTGSPSNDFEAEAYMHVQGNTFRDSGNYRKVPFNQNYKPIKNETK